VAGLRRGATAELADQEEECRGEQGAGDEQGSARALASEKGEAGEREEQDGDEYPAVAVGRVARDVPEVGEDLLRR
jgi:hypothetical protein